MPAVDQTEETTSSPSAPPAAPEEEPYSIFDRRQKAVIVLIVSTAATCKYIHLVGLPMVIVMAHIENSLRLRVQHLLPRAPYHCSRPRRLDRAC